MHKHNAFKWGQKFDNKSKIVKFRRLPISILIYCKFPYYRF